jgi:two-component system sensor histidine kinase KdpD
VALAFERAQIAEDAQRALFDVQKERLRNALLSSVSHDLRTPLAVVKGAVTALLDRNSELTASRRQEYLETISEEASRLNRLVRNLLDMTSLEAGALHARKEWQPLEEVLGVALNRMEEPLQNRPVRVAIAPDAALAPFDATLLEQVLVNLVENAVRYTPAGSPIDIRATREDGGVQVEIADRGPGIAPGQEERIFEKFKRAAPPTTGGMGLGLTICRGMIAVHGGTIWCENRPGGGASFRFLLPRDANAPLLDGLPEAPGEP